MVPMIFIGIVESLDSEEFRQTLINFHERLSS